MKKGIAVLIVLCLGVVVQAKDFDVTIWGGIETGNSDATAAMSGRLGIESKESNLEGFIGITGWPKWDAIEGRLMSEPPVVLEIGGIYHFDDIIDPNSPVPWIPEILAGYLNPELEARPYVGVLSTIGRDGSAYGTLVGFEMGKDENSNITLNIEGQFLNVGHELAEAGITDEFRVMIFLKGKAFQF